MGTEKKKRKKKHPTPIDRWANAAPDWPQLWSEVSVVPSCQSGSRALFARAFGPDRALLSGRTRGRPGPRSARLSQMDSRAWEESDFKNFTASSWVEPLTLELSLPLVQKKKKKRRETSHAQARVIPPLNHQSSQFLQAWHCHGPGPWEKIAFSRPALISVSETGLIKSITLHQGLRSRSPASREAFH